MSQNPSSLREPKVSGDVAAAAFASFDRGTPPDEVVTELILPVETAEFLWRTWARLRGAVPLSVEAAHVLREAVCDTRPISNGSDAVAAVRRFVERPAKPCTRCKKAFREYCTTCPAREAARAGRRVQRGSTKKRSGRHDPSEWSGVAESTLVRPGGVLSDADAEIGVAITATPAPCSRCSEPTSDCARHWRRLLGSQHHFASSPAMSCATVCRRREMVRSSRVVCASTSIASRTSRRAVSTSAARDPAEMDFLRAIVLPFLE